jgi:hypothetical protein
MAGLGQELERSGLPPQLTWEADHGPGCSSDGTGNYGSGVNVLNADNVCNGTG